MGANEIELSDLQRLARSDSPDLAQAVIAFLAQPDPAPEGELPPGAVTLQQMLAQVGYAALRWVPKKEKRERILTAWKTYLAQALPPPPPRFALAELLVSNYERGSDASRAAILHLTKSAPLRYGLWGGLKRIYKRAEATLDAELFGALAWSFDHWYTQRHGIEVSAGTLLYLRRRAWRFLRDLGRATPVLYPQFAAEVLRHYHASTRIEGTWIATHVFDAQRGRFTTRTYKGRLPADLAKHRAFSDAWRRSPDALMLLLESCHHDAVARFAIQGLRADFPERLRSVTPAWLARLARRELAAPHEFLVETLEGSADFHPSKLRALGLHDAVLALLTSPSPKARTYAIAYARAHAADLPADRVVALLEDCRHADTRAWCAATLQAAAPRALGFATLLRLLNQRETMAWAQKQLTEGFDRDELPEPFLRDALFGSHAERNWFVAYHAAHWKKAELDPGFWMRSLDDARARDNYPATQVALQALAAHPVHTLPTGWLLDAISLPYGPTVAGWIGAAESLPGLDVERVKGMVFNAALRPTALGVLGNAKLVKAREIGLPWLLALARRADPSLHDFAHRYLLANMKPEDFADPPSADAGAARLLDLALAEKEPEAIRSFAQTYLRCHHPTVGREQPETKSYRLTPALARAQFPAARLFNALWDHRPDVRRFAVIIARADLREWGYLPRVYELAESEHREVRAVAYDALLKAGESGAPTSSTLKVADLDAGKVFALTESRKKATREVAMEMIRRHYARLGGAERLAWLMESPDREVRLFSVRLLWERHRPTHLPTGWTPRRKGATAVAETERFADVEALRSFLRRTLYGLPPGRMERREDDRKQRHVPASEAKRNVIAVLRDMGVDDADFARLVAPVLEEFTGSLAQGEWQACLQALVQLRAAHPDVPMGGLR
jgi:hypothetical protein